MSANENKDLIYTEKKESTVSKFNKHGIQFVLSENNRNIVFNINDMWDRLDMYAKTFVENLELKNDILSRIGISSSPFIEVQIVDKNEEDGELISNRFFVSKINENYKEHISSEISKYKLNTYMLDSQFWPQVRYKEHKFIGS